MLILVSEECDIEWRVSAILTTYNRPELAKRALQSILDQTMEADEIIVVEDSGHGNLSDWIRGLGQAKIRYIRHEKNRGLAAARNTGLRLATGNFVAFLDDDDEWLPSRLESQYQRLTQLDQSTKQSLACFQVGCVFIGEDGEEIGVSMPINQGNLAHSIRTNGAVTPSSSFLFLREAIQSIGGFDEELISGIDHDIWMSLAVAGYSNEAICKPLVRIYRENHETMMTDVDKRISGLNQYIAKWTPVYQDWYGQIGGKTYAKKYFSKVIGRLASEKIIRGQWKEARVALSAIKTCIGADVRIAGSVFVLIAKSLLVHYVPWLVRLKGKRQDA